MRCINHWCTNEITVATSATPNRPAIPYPVQSCLGTSGSGRCLDCAVDMAKPFATRMRPVSISHAILHGPHTAHQSAALRLNLLSGGISPHTTKTMAPNARKKRTIATQRKAPIARFLRPAQCESTSKCCQLAFRGVAWGGWISDLRPDSVTYRDGLCGYRPAAKKLRRDGVFLYICKYRYCSFCP